MKMTRRSLLAGMACATPFLPILSSRAGGVSQPKRLILMFSACGTIGDAWRPVATEPLTFGPILEPLTPHRGRILQIGGLQTLKGGPGGNHAQGVANLWTAGGLLEGDIVDGGNGDLRGWGAGTSIDQFLAEDAVTPYKTLEFAVAPGDANINSRTIYAGPDQPVAPEPNPVAMFDRLFGDFFEDEDELKRVRAQKQSVIDVVKDELDHLRGKVGSEDTLKIDSHLEGILELERRLTAGVVDCEPPERPDLDASDAYPETGAAQMELLVMALKCGLTDIASLQWSRGVSRTMFTWLGHTDHHHNLSHEGDSNELAQQQLIEINTWYAEQFAALLDALYNTQEGDGTMLDNTLLVWGNELGKGNSHSLGGMPFVMAGNLAGYFDTGRAVLASGVEHNRLLVSICNAMGREDVDSYGETDTGTGPLPDLTSS